ncbi:hypothetical protein D3C80_1044660 [compost metagenome]
MLDERRTLAVLVIALLIVPASGEGDKAVLRLATQHLGVFHFQPQPGALCAPAGHGGTVQFRLLGRQGGVHQVIDQAQHVSAVARAHQRLGIGGRGSGMVVPAAGVQQVATATRAN